MMMTSTAPTIQAGYIALNDAAILIVAKECGFAEAEGIHLNLHKETSWATLRDKLAIGLFDVAHLLGPIPVAAACDLFPLPLDIVVPMSLGLGGNMITLSRSVWEAYGQDQSEAGQDVCALAAGALMRKIITKRRADGLAAFRFAAVHPYSAHNYELRYWLAGCGIHPDRDVDIVFLPPSTLPDALKSGAVDGYCVGEPWNTAAILAGDGVLLTTKAHIWQSSPEKVLGVRKAFAQEQPEAHFALLRALYKAALWIEDKENIGALCTMLARESYIGQDQSILAPGLSGMIATGIAQSPLLAMPDFYLPSSRAAVFPWQSHALWFYSQMVRWGHVPLSDPLIEKARNSYHPHYLRDALAPLGVPLPLMDAKIEGGFGEATAISSLSGPLLLGPDRFFDQKTFDPDQLHAYVAEQEAD